MKFKVGDKVRVKKNLDDIEKFVGGYTSPMGKMEGKIVTIKEQTKSLSGEPGYKIEEDGNSFIWDERAFESLNKIQTKDELLKLPTGTKITTDNDENNVFIKIDKGVFENENRYHLHGYKINDDLTITDIDCGTRITKVEAPTYETKYEFSKEVREMTIAEISKELGYEVKIIKE
jgi:hypothetical protein